MSRRSNKISRRIKPDPIYRNRLVHMVVNRIFKNGKKSLGYRILYTALKTIKRKTQKNPLLVLRQAVDRTTPKLVVKARRRGGSTYQVPVEIKPSQGKRLALRWLLNAARKRSGKSMSIKLTYEIIDAARKIGNAIRKKEETHRMAEANKAFSHYR